MPDPLGDPTFVEDVVHVDAGPQRVGLPPSRKAEQADAYQRKLDRERNELATVLESDEGQAVIMRILHECHVYHEGILDKPAQGRRVLGMRLIRRICDLGTEAYPNLLINHSRRQQKTKDTEDGIHASKTSDH